MERTELVANIARLKARCAALGIPVVYTAQPTDQPAGDRALLNDMWGPGLTTADPALAAIMPDIAPGADDLVLAFECPSQPPTFVVLRRTVESALAP